jgi:hypothetical protein
VASKGNSILALILYFNLIMDKLELGIWFIQGVIGDIKNNIDNAGIKNST